MIRALNIVNSSKNAKNVIIVLCSQEGVFFTSYRVIYLSGKMLATRLSKLGSYLSDRFETNFLRQVGHS